MKVSEWNMEILSVLRSRSALLGSALLLIILLIGVTIAAYVLTPVKGTPTTVVVVAKTTSSSNFNSTDLILSLRLPNGSLFTSGMITAGSYGSIIENGSYVFSNIQPGNYVLNLTSSPNYFLPESIKLAKGINSVNLTIYPLFRFTLFENPGLKYNDSSPGPLVSVSNGSAVRLQVFNNSSQINNIAIVNSLTNFSQSNVLFNSVSNSLSPGGSTNDTFIVSSTGFFYYASLFASQAKDGQYGYFNVKS
jgi:hypothetical protein